MRLTHPQHVEAALALRQAATEGRFLEPLRETYPGMEPEDAYAIQRLNTDDQQQRGRRVVGRKIGLTSRAVQQQLGVAEPDFGALFDDMAYGDGEPIPMARLHQPKVETEVAFVMDRDLDVLEPGIADLVRAIAYALPAIEVVGSRIAQWNIGFVDTVADNASAGVYVLGTTPRRLDGLDLRLAGMATFRRGEPVSTGAGAACLGSPLNAAVWLARTLARLGAPLRAGDVVLSGALGPMVPVAAGDVFDASIQGLGSVRAVFDNDKGEMA